MTTTYTEAFSVSIERDVKSNQIVSETWRDDRNRLHRTNDLPAVIQYEPEFDKPVQIEFWFKNQRNRENGPAIQMLDPQTGVVIHEEWHLLGKPFRVGGPTVIDRDPQSGDVLNEEFTGSQRRISQSPGSNGPS